MKARKIPATTTIAISYVIQLLREKPQTVSQLTRAYIKSMKNTTVKRFQPESCMPHGERRECKVRLTRALKLSFIIHGKEPLFGSKSPKKLKVGQGLTIFRQHQSVAYLLHVNLPDPQYEKN